MRDGESEIDCAYPELEDETGFSKEQIRGTGLRALGGDRTISLQLDFVPPGCST